MEPDQHDKGNVNSNPSPENGKVLPENGKVLHEGKAEDFPSAASVTSSSSQASLDTDIDKTSSFNDQTNHLQENQLPGNETPPWSMLSASPPLGPEVQPSPEPSSIPQMKSPPPVQTMGPPGPYDPNRIPAHVFSTKASSNPLEWSSASNESLFSIHMGNNSFTQEFGKSGELMRLDDWSNNNNNSSQFSHELSSSNLLPPVMEEHTLDFEDAPKVSSEANMEDHGKEKVGRADQAICSPDSTHAAENNRNSLSTPRASTSNARLSEESGHSGHSCSSFAFPVQASPEAEIANTSIISCLDLRLVDAGKTTSLGVGPMEKQMKQNEKTEKYEKPETVEKPEEFEKPELEEQVSKPSSPKPASKGCPSKWFSWFSCWPRCC